MSNVMHQPDEPQTKNAVKSSRPKIKIIIIALLLLGTVMFLVNNTGMWTTLIVLMTTVIIAMWVRFSRNRTSAKAEATSGKPGGVTEELGSDAEEPEYDEDEGLNEDSSEGAQEKPTADKSPEGKQGDSEESTQELLDTTKILADLTVDELMRLVDRIRNKPRLPEPPRPVDNTVYWDKNPHPKHFLKRIWRIALYWAIAIALSALSVYMNQWSLPFFICASGVMYTLRRLKKWNDLRLKIVGSRLIIQEAKSRIFFLNGQTRTVSLIKCSNVATKQTTLEQYLKLNCGSIDVDTPSDEKDSDWFRNLKDVRDNARFEELLLERMEIEQRNMANRDESSW